MIPQNMFCDTLSISSMSDKITAVLLLFSKAQCSTVVVHHQRQLFNSTKPYKLQTH